MPLIKIQYTVPSAQILYITPTGLRRHPYKEDRSYRVKSKME